jgi:DNA-binding CsgD family transcriptional regulator/tetratricopeptide (TPR) repeat protein
LLAGREAMAALAYDEAEARFATALSLGMPDPRRVAETQLELGTACSRGGRSERAIEAYRAAADLARELGDDELLATAAVGFEDACWRPAIIDQGAIELLKEASAALPEDDSTLRVKVLAGLARALDFVGESAQSSPVREAAETMARRLDDREGLAKVLVRSYWSRDVREFSQTLDMLAEARDLAHGIGDDELEIDAREWRVAGLIALGELDRAHEEHSEVLAIALRLRQPFPMHVAEHYGSTLALCDGRLADAEASANRSHEWARLLTGRPPSGIHGIQMFSIRREQDRLDELSPVMRLLVGGDAPGGAWRPGLAALLAELGLEAETRRELDGIRREGFDGLRASLWLASLTYLADACAAVGDDELAALLYPELAPLAGGNVAIGHGVVCYGAADRYLGLLAATLGEHDLAADHFEDALTLNRRMHAPTWTANTLLAYGRTLRARGRAADLRGASALLSDAATLAEATALPMVLRRARELGADGARPAPLPLPDELSSREVDVLRLVATGRSNREIGEELFISGHTVANHMRSILRKTGAANRTEAAGYAYRNSLLDTGDAR